MRSAILTLLLTSVAAFSPSLQKFTPVTVRANSFSKEVGAQAPLGCFDPLGLLKDADQARFNRLREVELKHGRIAMLAVLGHITTTAGVRFAGDLGGVKFADIPNGLAALNVVPTNGWIQIVAFIGLLETAVMKDSANGAGPGEFVGDFRNGTPDFGWSSYSAATKLQKRAVELNNGRAAQMGILGLMVHEKLNNDPYLLNHLLGAPVAFNA